MRKTLESRGIEGIYCENVNLWLGMDTLKTCLRHQNAEEGRKKVDTHRRKGLHNHADLLVSPA